MPPSPALRDHLQSALGGAYTIEREIEGGGMSRIFVADETGLGRRVVVKVLPPDLASVVSTDRFRREILVVAKLQHPHIVPVLSAGEANGTLYFTMPFVDGESLRDRLARPERIALSEAIRIIRDVAEALDYAHARGLIHRDIKPGNILLSGGHALVTDFGVAKAIDAAASGVDRPHRGSEGSVTTTFGVALGTPAYMAPEQALGDRATDHRADLYALGCVAYEMLTGRHVFPDRPLQAVVAAHATEPPEPIERHRADVPAALAELVMRCLAKLPQGRPQAASEIVRQLDGLVSGVGSRASSNRVRPTTSSSARRAALAGVVALAGVTAWAWGHRARSTVLDRNVIMIAPLRVSGDASIAFLREGMVDLLSANLTGEGGPRAVDPRATFAAWRAAGGDDHELTTGDAQRVARRLGAGRLLLATVVGGASSVTVATTLIDTEGGRPATDRIEGRPDRLGELTDRLTKVVLASQATPDPRRRSLLEGVPLPALRAYLEGNTLFRRGRFAEAVDVFDRALREDSTFAPAALAMTLAASWSGRLADQGRGIRLAWASRDALSERDLALARVYASWQLDPREADIPRGMDVALALWDSAARLAPDNPEVLHERADFLFHYAPSFMPRDDAHRQSGEVFSRVLALDSSYASAYEHLVDLASEAGDTARARWAAAKYFALDSTGDHADYVRWRLAHATGDSSAIRAVRERMSSATFGSLHRIAGLAVLDGIGDADLDAASRAMMQRARTRDEMRTAALARAAEAFNRGQPALAWEIGKHAARPDSAFTLMTLFWDADPGRLRAAARGFERALSRPASDPRLTGDDRYVLACSLAEWHLAEGDTSAAKRMVPHLRAHLPEAVGTRVDGVNASTEGLCIAMVEAWLAVHRRTPKAVELTAHFDSLVQRSIAWDALLEMPLVASRLWEALGDRPRALAALRHRPYHWSPGLFFGTTYFRAEGRLAEAVGDDEGAVRAYRAFLALRTDPEPRLAAEVATVRQRLAGLEQRTGAR